MREKGESLLDELELDPVGPPTHRLQVMKRGLAALILLYTAMHLRAAEVVFPYSAFGPQSAAYKLIGMEWWQWDPHGASCDRVYPIKVVVYWDQTKEETAKRYPVSQAMKKDFRYVEYADAIEHLERTVKGFKEAKLDSSTIESTLAQLRRQKAEQDHSLDGE